MIIEEQHEHHHFYGSFESSPLVTVQLLQTIVVGEFCQPAKIKSQQILHNLSKTPFRSPCVSCSSALFLVHTSTVCSLVLSPLPSSPTDALKPTPPTSMAAWLKQPSKQLVHVATALPLPPPDFPGL